MLQWITLQKYASEYDLNNFILWIVCVNIFLGKGDGWIPVGELMDRNERTEFRTNPKLKADG